MLRSYGSFLAAFILVTAALASVVTPAVAKTQGSIQVAPHKVKIGTQATITGKHLLSNKYYYLILSVGNYLHPSARTFISKTPRSNKNGDFKVRFKMPVMALCGKSDIAAFHSSASGVLHASFTLSGCSRPKKITSPPAPPKKR